jgi:hypothetical protein
LPDIDIPRQALFKNGGKKELMLNKTRKQIEEWITKLKKWIGLS